MKLRTKHLLATLLCCLLCMMRSTPSLAQVPTSGVGVYYLGPEDSIAASINLAHPLIVRVDQPELAQVIIMNNARLSEEELRFYGEQVRNNRLGLIIFCGSIFPTDVEDLGNLLGISAFGMTEIHTPAVIEISGDADALHGAATWTSAPELNARTVISNPNILLPLIVTETGQPVIQRIRGREPAQTLIVSAWLDDASNSSVTTWPYYHYLIYRLIVDAAGRSRFLTFADYHLTPVPQRNARLVIAGAGLGIILGTAIVFYLARRFRFMHTGEWQHRIEPREDSLVRASGWEKVGFHRPLAGLLTLLPVNLLLFFALARYRLYILPEVMAPNPQAFTSWQFVEHWAEFIWLLLDAGTGIAAVKLFASSHIQYPRQAFRYFQFYCWWQLFIGAVQLVIVALLSAVVIPGVGFAHLTYFILLQSIVRFPGFLFVFLLFFRAMQRMDYEQYLAFFITYGSPALQALAYMGFKAWGTAIPAWGQNQINILGLGTGLYAAEWLGFIWGLLLYRRQGYRLAALFLPVSDTITGKQILSFGIPAALGPLTAPLGVLIQLAVLRSTSPVLDTMWEQWITVIQVITIFELILKPFYQNLLPSLTEAITLKYQTLLRYYLVQGTRYGMWLSVFILAVFVVMEKHFMSIIIPGRDPIVSEALLFLLAVASFRWGTWLVDNLLLATGRPGLSSLLYIIEQVLYIGGGLFLAQQWGINGLLSAYAIAFLVHILLGWVIMQRTVIHIHVYLWQTLVSPALSGLLIYYILYVMLESISSLEHFFIILAILPLSLAVYALLTALFGGWDDTNVLELGRAVAMCGIGKPYAWILWQCVRFGAWLSPLHGRFPIHIASIAEEQALSITYTRSTKL